MAISFRQAFEAGLEDGREQQFPRRTATVVRTPRFYVPSGTKCAIKKVADPHGDYRPYRTLKAAGFERFERWVKTEIGNFYEFRLDGWNLMVLQRFVRHR